MEEGGGPYSREDLKEAGLKSLLDSGSFKLLNSKLDPNPADKLRDYYIFGATGLTYSVPTP